MTRVTGCVSKVVVKKEADLLVRRDWAEPQVLSFQFHLHFARISFPFHFSLNVGPAGDTRRSG